MYIGIKTGEIYDLNTIGYVAAHEFGHVAFKLLDIYNWWIW